MKKCILIVLIFLVGFIFAGTHTTKCEPLDSSQIIIQNSAVKIEQENNFTDYENFITNENLKNLKSINNPELSTNSPIKFATAKDFQLKNEGSIQNFKNQKTKISKSNNNNLNLYPRAP